MKMLPSEGGFKIPKTIKPYAWPPKKNPLRGSVANIRGRDLLGAIPDEPEGPNTLKGVEKQ